MNAVRARTLISVLSTRRTLYPLTSKLLLRLQSTSTPPPSEGQHGSGKLIYTSPTETPVRLLKIFCVSGTAVTIAAAPFLLSIESTLPMVARISTLGLGLFGTASTAIFVARFFKGFVLSTRRHPDGHLLFETSDIYLRKRITTVFDPAFLVRSTKPTAKFELARSIAGVQAGQVGSEETVAQTTDVKGKVLGRWVVRWREDGTGECGPAGNIVQDFQLAEELLSEPLSPALSKIDVVRRTR